MKTWALWLCAISLTIGGPAGIVAGQTSPGAAAGVAATSSTAPAAKVNYDDLFDTSCFVVAGKLQDQVRSAEPDWHYLQLKVSTGFFADETQYGSTPGETPLHFSDADGYQPGQEGIFFAQRVNGKYEVHGARLRPIGEKDAVTAALVQWLNVRIPAQLKAVADAYKKDPDCDAEASWKAMSRLVALGKTEIYCPAYHDKKADHPSKEHLAELYKVLGADLRVVPYPRTPEEITQAVAVLAPTLDKNVRQRLSDPKAADFQETLNGTLAFYLYERFSAVEETLGLDGSRFQADREDLAKLLPAGAKVTRMAAFRAKLAALDKTRAAP